MSDTESHVLADSKLDTVSGGTSGSPALRCPSFNTPSCTFQCPYLNTPGCVNGYRYTGVCRAGSMGRCATVLCRLYNTAYCAGNIIK